jgi:hypothetical protein
MGEGPAEMTETEKLMVMREGLVADRRAMANNAASKRTEAYGYAERIMKYQDLIEAIDRAIADERAIEALGRGPGPATD